MPELLPIAVQRQPELGYWLLRRFEQLKKSPACALQHRQFCAQLQLPQTLRLCVGAAACTTDTESECVLSQLAVGLVPFWAPGTCL